LHVREVKDVAMTTAEKNAGSNIAPGFGIGDLLSAIDPKNSPAFSANLHRWMRSHLRCVHGYVFLRAAFQTLVRLDVDWRLMVCSRCCQSRCLC